MIGDADNVVSPDYYQLVRCRRCSSTVENHQVVRDWRLNFGVGTAVYYLARAGKKRIEGQSLDESYLTDLRKASRWLAMEISEIENSKMRNEENGG